MDRKTLSRERRNWGVVYIGNQYFSNKLTAGGYIIREATMTLPQTLGIEGDVRLRVDVEPNSTTGEYIADRANNSAMMDNTAWLSRRYFLSAGSTTIREGGSVRLTVKRSGDRSMDETLPVTTDNELITVPASVTIPAGQSSASFTVACPDNNTVNERSDATITVGSANDIAFVGLTIDDDDLLALTASLDKDEYNEGDVMHLTVSVPRRIGTDDVVLSFNIEQPKRFKLPQSYTFEPGATTAVIDIPVLQDKTPANQTSIQLTVSATHHEPATVLFILNDDDTPAIDLTLTPEAVSEGAGANAIYGTITRQGVTDSKITLKLSDDSEGELYYTTPIMMAEGVTTATFPIGIRDNDRVDGDRRIAFTAEIYLTDCNCAAIGDLQTSVTKTILVTDNDGPTLSITSSKSTILEGNAEGTVLTISRNDDTANPLTVRLTASVDDVTMPSTVTIPAGQASVTTRLTANTNATKEGNRAITVQASADGYSSGTTWILISDQTLPDLCLVNPTLLVSGLNFDLDLDADINMAAGTPYTLTLPVQNIGSAVMPRGTEVSVKITPPQPSPTGEGAYKVTAVIGGDLAPNETTTLTVDMPGIDVPGRYTLTVTLNPEQRVQELQYVNNTAKSEFTVTSVYGYVISTPNQHYLPGDEVTLNGTVISSVNGTAAANTEVEVYVDYSTQHTTINATTDLQGRFNATYTIPEGMGGTYSYGVCVPGEGSREAMGTFITYGMMRSTTDYIKHNLYVGESYIGTLSIKNQSALPLHNLRATVTDPSGHYDVTVTPIRQLVGNGTATMQYTITSRAISTGKDWEQVILRLSSDEGAAFDVTFYNYTRTRQPSLVVLPGNINTTVSKQAPRHYELVLTNTGMGETGEISVSLPQGLSNLITLLTPAQMPSIATGDSARVMLRFNGSDYDINVVQRGNIAINCQQGNGVSVPFAVKVVSQERGNLCVRVQDENTVYGTPEGEHPYVANATVQLSDYNTGAIVASATTTADGSITFADLNEGYYQLYVTADRHDSYCATVLISPGETTEHIATISYQAVTVTWTVEETTVDDVYNITTTVTYETHVPVPVVLIDVPDTIALARLHQGESLLFNVQLANKGLIMAQHVHLGLPDVPGYTLTPLTSASDIDMAAQTHLTIPVLAVRGTDADETDLCNIRFNVTYQWPVAELMKTASNADVANTARSKCVGNSGAWTDSGSSGGSTTPPVGNPGTSTTTTTTSGGSTTSATIQKPVICKNGENSAGSNSSICAYVKLQFEQQLVLTRQAFRGTLTVDNRLDTPLTDISLAITATDLLGNIATNREMQISIESIRGFEGSKDGEWSLATGQTGTATILFVPSKYAAPDTLTTYAFGGTLYFNDGNGLQSRGLYPVNLQVKPSPELDLTYFVQRDIYGDNPLTEDVVEPIIPAEFTVLVHNKGKGDATDVRMITHQPEIVENELGLKIDFAIVGSSLNGKDHALALSDDIVTQFGDIPSGTASYATWDLTSTLLGHFVDYDISYTHVTSYGNPDLSLLNKVTVHELIHSVNARVGGKTYRAWVTDDEEDEMDSPDHIYLSNGTDEELTTLTNVTTVTNLGNNRYRISVTVPQRGWFYTKVTNPAGAVGIITAITDETTGERLDAQNFWTTQYTMRDGYEPVRENKLHIVDVADAPAVRSYIVEYIDPSNEITVHAEKGWNWIASNVLHGPLVQNAIGDNLIEVRTTRQMIYNDPEWGYFGDADLTLSADNDNGHFRVKLHNAQDIILTGTTNMQPTWSNLHPNWNWVGNPYFADFDINDYPHFWSALCEGDILKAKNGYFATLEDGEWDGWLETMETGKAYVLWTTSTAQSIQFDAAALLTSSTAPRHRAPKRACSPWVYDDSQFEDNMSIIATIEGVTTPEDFTVGTFVGDECRGEGKYSKNKWYIFAHGESGDIVSFRLLHLPTGTMVELDTTLPFAASAGTSKEPVKLFAPDNLDDILAGIETTSVPSRARVYNIQGMEVTAPRISRALYIINGRKVMIK